MEFVKEKPKRKEKTNSRIKKSLEIPPSESVPLESTVGNVDISDILSSDNVDLFLKKDFNNENSKESSSVLTENEVITVQNDDEVPLSGLQSEIEKSQIAPLFPLTMEPTIETTNRVTINETEEMQELLLDSPLQKSEMKSPLVNLPEPVKIVIEPYNEQQLSALYINSEMEILDVFAEQFCEAQLRGVAIKQHPLYELLTKYLLIRERITGNRLEVDQLRAEYRELQEALWLIENVTCSGRGQCQDGSSVTAQHTYKTATFQRSVFQSLCRVLSHVRTLIYGNYTLFSFTAEDLRQQIEFYVSRVLDEHQLPSTNNLPEIRLCISVLFAFQRRLIRDESFSMETRYWLTRFIVVLLRSATFEDHLFILHHILRCPAGVGQWAANFIQIPSIIDEALKNENVEEEEQQHHQAEAEQLLSPFDSPHLNHALCILAVILMPIRERSRFLEELSQGRSGDCDDEGLWIVVDSDGEEDEESGNSLRENDLVALLAQIPIEDVFRKLLFIENRDLQDRFDPSTITAPHCLRFFAFSTRLLAVFHNGLNTYNHSRYHQFCKRLSRWVRYVVEYVTDLWQLYKSTNVLVDDNAQYSNLVAMRQRLQVEYDSFVTRAVHLLYGAQKLGAWQFLAVLPYDQISQRTVWTLYRFLLNGNDEDTHTNCYYFQEKCTQMADDELYYLLNTFTNMALNSARDNENFDDFIEIVATDLLRIGFFTAATQEQCSKCVRDLLSQITGQYSGLLSRILRDTRDNLDICADLALYLYEELPVDLWQFTSGDLEIISSLLLNNASCTTESRLARYILARLDWTNVEHRLQCNVAVLVVRAANQDAQLVQWAWPMLFRLRLHYFDTAATSWSEYQVLDPDHYDVINKSINQRSEQRCPLASFLSLCMTSWGHLVPLICTDGLQQLQLLQCQYKRYDAVLFALQRTIPLFVNCQEYVINSERLQAILTDLLTTTNYLEMAKSLVVVPTNSSNGTVVLQQFGNMLRSQFASYNRYDLETPRSLVRLWLNAFLSIPQWNRHVTVLQLLDTIIGAVFGCAASLDVVRATFRELLLCTTNGGGGAVGVSSSPNQDSTATLSSLLKWAWRSGVGGGAWPTVSLIQQSVLSEYTCLAYILIDVEYQEREQRSGLWQELMVQLHLQKGKVNVDAAIKTAANRLKVTSFTSSLLAIYRWAQQAMDTPLSHPILPLIYQKFFVLYLARPLSCDTSMGYKFFDGLVNFAFFKRLKKRLQETVDYYESELKDTSVNRQFTLNNYYSVFRAFNLWLEEPRLQKDNIVLATLPPQYLPQLLITAQQGIDTPWFDYVDFDRLKRDESEAVQSWQAFIFRAQSKSKTINHNASNSSPFSSSKLDPMERLLNRLKLNTELPKPPPLLAMPTTKNSSSSSTNQSVEVTATSNDVTTPTLRTLLHFARNHTLKLSENSALDAAYLELVPELYRTVNSRILKKVPCRSVVKGAVHCSGPAHIALDVVSEGRCNDRVDHQMATNRRAYDNLIGQVLQAPANVLCIASSQLQMAIRHLETGRAGPHEEEEKEVLNKRGVALFYKIVQQINEETLAYPPTKALFTTCLERLAQTHLIGREAEMPRLLDTILQQPHLSDYLLPHFTLHNVSTHTLLFMYARICRAISSETDCQHELLRRLLVKFLIADWLLASDGGISPKLRQRTTFIKTVMAALMQLGQTCSASTTASIETERLHSQLRQHLVEVFTFQFPEHYGEILIQLLDTSSSSSNSISSNNNADGGVASSGLAASVWFDVLRALTTPTASEFNVKCAWRDQFRQYAQLQTRLQLGELLETAQLLATHFAQLRIHDHGGVCGLYSAARYYIEIYAILLGMIGHALLVSMIRAHQGLLGDRLVEKIWPHLTGLFTPWLVPYSRQERGGANDVPTTDECSVLLPWLPADSALAHKMIESFFECISFVIATLPASRIVFSYIWQWYVTSYCHSAVKDYILGPVHSFFLNFQWSQFWPTPNDLEVMLRVVDQYLPETHGFLGQIFMQIPWMQWLRTTTDQCQQQQHIHPAMQIRIHQCFIVLLVKLANEPKVKRNPEAMCHLVDSAAATIDWTLLDTMTYQHVLDWYVMSCDPQPVLFNSDPTSLDVKVFNFLKTVSGHYLVTATPTLQQSIKRLLFIKAIVKLLTIHTSRNKNAVHLQKDVSTLLTKLLHHLDAIVQSEAELKQILQELMLILNIDLEQVQTATIDCLQKWIQHKSGNSVQVKATLGVLGVSHILDASHTAKLFELTLGSYFENNLCGSYEPTWREATTLITVLSGHKTTLESAMLNQSCALSLSALLIQRYIMPDANNDALSTAIDLEVQLNRIIDWLPLIRLVDDTTAAKVPLLWLCILHLVRSLVINDENSAALILHKFATVLLQIAVNGGPGNGGTAINLSVTRLLNVIGIGTVGSSGASLGFRFLCRALGAYVLAQLPEVRGGGGARTVRKCANAPARVGQIGGNAECAKILMSLDFSQQATGQNASKMKDCEVLALSQIQAAENSLHNADRFLLQLLKHFYVKPYLKDIS